MSLSNLSFRKRAKFQKYEFVRIHCRLFSLFRRYVGRRNGYRIEKENCLSVLTVEVFVKHFFLNVVVEIRFSENVQSFKNTSLFAYIVGSLFRRYVGR
jgi:hypothetical protein